MTDDDDLRARLRRADPAAALEPAAPEQVSRLVEETMSRTHTRRWALPVAAALVLVAAGTAWAVTRPSGPPTGELDSLPALEVSLTATGVSAKCREPEASRLSEISDFAFEGSVSGIDAGTVRLDVTHVFRGAQADSVRVAQAGSSSEQMLGSGTFEQGKKYLVASEKGQVLICGYSGEADAIGLRELYEAAF